MKNFTELDESKWWKNTLAAAAAGASMFGAQPSYGDNVEAEAKPVQNVEQKAEVEKIGGYTVDQVADILSKTIYEEAKGEDEKGLDAVATVIWNRSGGDKTRFVEVCFKWKQFSIWNAEHPENNENYLPDKYQKYVPMDLLQKGHKEAYRRAYLLAFCMLNGTFKPLKELGNRNSYYNPSSSKPKWANRLQNVLVIGKHKFGFLPEYDGFHTSGKVEYVAKSDAEHTERVEHEIVKGDSLDKIAREYGTTVRWIKQMNPNDAKNPSNLKLGAKLYIGYKKP